MTNVNIALCEKISKISKSMDDFSKLLFNTNNELDFNLNKINQLQEVCNDFISFIKIINVYEIYRWNNIKSEYSFIKKKINKDKKTIHIITKLFASLTNYYDQNEIDNINININNISSKTDLMLYNFDKLHIIHNNVCIKKKHIVYNDDFIKIDSINDDNKQILSKLYENYISIKLLNNEQNNLKNIKKQLVRDIKNLSIKN
jgi:hypothetical protein